MKGCLIVVALVFVLVAGGGVFIWINKDTIITGISEAFEMPEYGKQEYIDQEYGESLRTFDAAAGNASSIMTFGAAIEGMTLPEEVLYVGIYKEDDKTDTGINKEKEKIDVIKRFDLSNIHTLIMYGYGAGSLSKAGVSTDIMIYENVGPWDYMDKFIVYIEYTGGKEEIPSE